MRNLRLGRLMAIVVGSAMMILGPVVGEFPTAAAAATIQPSPQHRQHSAGSARYVALGDSYSSGEGSGSYLPGTATAADRCHRSRYGYPYLLHRGQRALRSLAFVACSGATTYDLYHANLKFPNERRQLAALGRRTREVSITIGGNDVGFSEVIAGCLAIGPLQALGCSSSARVNTLLQSRISALAGSGTFSAPSGHRIVSVTSVIGAIHARAPHARIFLAGYPELFGDRTKDFTADPAPSTGFSCVVNSAIAARVGFADAQWFNRRTRQLDGVYSSAVRRARRAGIRATYVSPSTFNHHGLCDRHASWIRPLVLTGALPAIKSFHPTRTGQRRGYAVAFRRVGL